jgi:hypothetical protein
MPVEGAETWMACSGRLRRQPRATAQRLPRCERESLVRLAWPDGATYQVRVTSRAPGGASRLPVSADDGSPLGSPGARPNCGISVILSAGILDELVQTGSPQPGSARYRAGESDEHGVRA